jgi:hypothetical protein
VSTTLPRLELEDFPPALAAALEPRVKRLGYLGEFFKCCAHQPEALAAFVQFTEAGRNGLSDRLVEVIALTCTTWMENDYERNQHERLCVRLGLDRDWVAAVNALKPDADSPLTAEERQLQRLTLTVLNTHGKGAGDSFEEAVQSLGPRLAIAVLMVIGRYVVHGLIINTLGLKPPVPSIFQ